MYLRVCETPIMHSIKLSSLLCQISPLILENALSVVAFDILKPRLNVRNATSLQTTTDSNVENSLFASEDRKFFYQVEEPSNTRLKVYLFALKIVRLTVPSPIIPFQIEKNVCLSMDFYGV